MSQPYILTALQQRILSYRGHVGADGNPAGVMGIMSCGSRGTGKSVALIAHILDYAQTWGSEANILVTREQWAGLTELQTEIYEQARLRWPTTTRNKNEGVISCGNGATIYFTNISDADSYAKVQGRSFQFLAFDECGNYPPAAWGLCQKIRSNARGKPGQPIQIHGTANALGRNHHRIYKDFVLASPPWRPFREGGTGDWWVWCSSKFGEGVCHTEQYKRQLEAATATDPALRRAWIDNEWSPAGGNLFACFDPRVHVVDVPAGVHLGPQKTMMGGDFGMAAPSVALVGTKIFTDRLPALRGSIIIRAEYASVASWHNLAVGDGTPPVQLAQRFKDLGKPYGTREIVMDDSRGISSPDQTVVNILNSNGLWATKPHKKDRIGGWAVINQLLHNAVRGEGPGLYIDKSCRYLLETLPEAPRDDLRREDMCHRYDMDHACDALSYLVRELRTRGDPKKQTTLIGCW